MRAVLVICEGRHDIAFVQRSMCAIAGGLLKGVRVGELPSPFGTIPRGSDGLIAEHIEKSAKRKRAADRKLLGAAILPLPQFDDAVWDDGRNEIYLFVNSGGIDRHDDVIELLEGVDESMDLPGFDMDITEYATAFLVDANDRGIDETQKNVCNRYSNHFRKLSATAHATWTDSDKCPVGIFIFCRCDGTGTLEDHVAPMAALAWKERYKNACNFIDQGKKNSDKVSRRRANRLKAIIACVGQFNFPGDSLFSVIKHGGRDGGIPDSEFKNSKVSNELVEFLQGVRWDNGGR